MPTDTQQELTRLEGELKRLEAEYNMYFAARRARPPLDIRARVETVIKRIDRGHIQNTGDRFRFSTLQARHASLVELWDRAQRAREEGRPGPFAPPAARREPFVSRPENRILHVSAFQDPSRELDKLRQLYDSLAEARMAAGVDPVAFDAFAKLVTDQVTKLSPAGSGEVAFRVALKDGKVNFTARAMGQKKPKTD